MTFGSVALVKSPGRDGVLREIERLGAGGEMNESLMARMTREDRVMFEVALIDALSFWPDDQQNRLRSALLKCGFDEQCSRRLHRCGVSGQVRISTLLELLKCI